MVNQESSKYIYKNLKNLWNSFLEFSKQLLENPTWDPCVENPSDTHMTLGDFGTAAAVLSNQPLEDDVRIPKGNGWDIINRYCKHHQ